MDSKLKFTDVPEESNFYDLVAGDNVLEIPLFQRPYMWKQRHLKAFWEDVERLDFIDGYPGRYAIIARRSGDSWYVAGINADGAERMVELDLSFLGGRTGSLMTDGDTERSFMQAPIKAGKTRISIKPQGGFIAVFK